MLPPPVCQTVFPSDALAVKAHPANAAMLQLSRILCIKMMYNILVRYLTDPGGETGSTGRKKAKRHTGVHAPAIVWKHLSANTNLALAA